MTDPGWVPKHRIGGGDAPKLLEISPYGDPLSVYNALVEGIYEPWNPRMLRGAMYEPVLRALAQRMVKGLELEDSDTDKHSRPDLPFAVAQVDNLGRLKGMPCVVDYKSQNRFVKGWGPPGSDVVPEHLRAQMAQEMFCTDRDLGLLVVGFGDERGDQFVLSNVATYYLQRDGAYESALIAIERHFWTEHVCPRVPPPASKRATKRKKAAA